MRGVCHRHIRRRRRQVGTRRADRRAVMRGRGQRVPRSPLLRPLLCPPHPRGRPASSPPSPSPCLLVLFSSSSFPSSSPSFIKDSSTCVRTQRIPCFLEGHSSSWACIPQKEALSVPLHGDPLVAMYTSIPAARKHATHLAAHARAAGVCVQFVCVCACVAPCRSP